jgi:hypothetical protein
MYDYPDGKVAAPLIEEFDSAVLGAEGGDLDMGPDVYFWGVRITALKNNASAMWRPKLTASDTAALTSSDSFVRALPKEGDSFESPLFPANQRPSAVRFLCDAGSVRVEIVRVVRQ